jgi:hypothetical protein
MRFLRVTPPVVIVSVRISHWVFVKVAATVVVIRASVAVTGVALKSVARVGRSGRSSTHVTRMWLWLW